MSTSLVFLFLSEPWRYIGRYIARASTSNPRSLTVLHVHGMMYLEMCYSLVFTICICSPLRGYPYGIVMQQVLEIDLLCLAGEWTPNGAFLQSDAVLQDKVQYALRIQ